jgi:hypothetical protein
MPRIKDAAFLFGGAVVVFAISYLFVGSFVVALAAHL